MTDPTPASLIQLGAELSRLSLAIAKEGTGQSQKADRSVVTVADYALQALVAHRLAEGYLGPCQHLIGEERGADLASDDGRALLERAARHLTPSWPDVTADAVLAALNRGDHGGGSGTFWCLDPIDGTRGYVDGRHYAIALALVESGAPTLGMLACPRLGTSGEPVDGGGVVLAARRDGNLLEAPLAGGDATVLKRAIAPEGRLPVTVPVERSHGRVDVIDGIAEALGLQAELLPLDSQAKYAAVAQGRADLYLRLSSKPGYREKIWDHAAGALIAEAAGAVVSDAAGKRLDFTQGETLANNDGIVCATAAIHGQVIATLAE